MDHSLRYVLTCCRYRDVSPSSLWSSRWYHRTWRTTRPGKSPGTSGARTTPTTTRSTIRFATSITRSSTNTAATNTHQRSPTVALAWFAFIIVQPPHQLDIQRESTTPPATAPARRSSIDRRCGRSSKANATLRDSKRGNVHTIYYEPTTDPDSCPFYYWSLVHPFDCTVGYHLPGSTTCRAMARTLHQTM